MKEIFKDIPNYKGYYQISNFGRVKSLKRKGCLKERILGLILNYGYYGVNLSKNGKCKFISIHKLILFTFIGKSNGLECNHKDCNKLNNNLENLEYITKRENMQHAWRNGVFNHKRKVSQFDLKGSFIKTFNSIKEAGKQTGTNNSCISFCCNNRIKTSNKFIWRFV